MTRNPILYVAVLLLMNSFVAGCVGTRVDVYQAAGERQLCATDGKDLGYVAIVPEFAWRADQKEPEKRTRMALEEIQRSFEDFPCGLVSRPGGLRERSDRSDLSEHALLENLRTEGVDTVVFVRVEELTPRLAVTFSLPFLWAGSNEADFRIRALSVRSERLLMDMRIRRVTGGPFNIRPAEWARVELRTALDDVISTSK